MSEKPVYPQRTGSFARVKNENGEVTLLERSEINWRESKRLHDLPVPAIRDHQYPDGLDGYLDEIIAFANRILNLLGVDDPQVPLPIIELRKLHDSQRMRESADGYVALRLLEYATSLKRLRKEKAPTPTQLDFAVYSMAEIAELLHSGDSAAAQRARAQPDNYDRDEDICRRRAAGERVSALANEYGLSEKQISRIARKNKK